MIRLQAVIFVLACVLLCTAATRFVRLADATCQLVHQYSGTLDNPTWVGPDYCLEQLCPGSTTDKCQIVQIQGDQWTEQYECNCPNQGGGANQGCHGVGHWAKVGANWVFANIECKGACDTGKNCATQTVVNPGTNPPGAPTGNYARCKCI